MSIKYAVLVVDMMNDFFEKGILKQRRSELVRAINTLVRESRMQGHPVIWARMEFSPDLSDGPLLVRKKKIYAAIVGTEGCKLLSDLDCQPSDYKIIKKRQSAFFGTNLDGVFSQLGITHVVICGIATDACVRTTAIDAYQRDLEVIIPRECVAAMDPTHEDISLRYLHKAVIAQVMPLASVINELRNL
ncbi:MAG: cysteine hydrolase [Dehalococcoidia bacterium]|nr:cysteine hydrolase [Dehalococcoidia bacterium]